MSHRNSPSTNTRQGRLNEDAVFDLEDNQHRVDAQTLEQEISQLENIFSEMDKNGDGRVDKAEFKAYLRTHPEGWPLADVLQATDASLERQISMTPNASGMFPPVGSNNDVSTSEPMSPVTPNTLSVITSKLSDDMVQFWFSKLDLEKDGTFDKNEFVNFYVAVRNVHLQKETFYADFLLALFDRNMDGKIDEGEYRLMLTVLFGNKQQSGRHKKNRQLVAIPKDVMDKFMTKDGLSRKELTKLLHDVSCDFNLLPGVHYLLHGGAPGGAQGGSANSGTFSALELALLGLGVCGVVASGVWLFMKRK